MKRVAFLLTFLFLFSAVNAFSIISYENNAEVLSNGDLNVYEKMTFDLDQVYSEGYRSIRAWDFDSLDGITVHSVKVNGNNVQYMKVMNGENAEIIWKKTYLGQNIVELNYTLSNRVELFDDYARVCYEHYGANWPVSAQSLTARMKLPERTRRTTMHFQIYSQKMGDAYVDDLTIVTEMENVPSGNYVGGCYLFFKKAVNTTKIRSGSAYEILQDERESYGSVSMLEPDFLDMLCASIFPFVFLGLLVFAYRNREKKEKEHVYPENILPPEKEEPSVVSVLMRQELANKDILAATILQLISRGVIDIVELEKKGAASGTLSKERTILIYKKKNAKLKDYEHAVIAMLFEKGDEVDLDKMAKEFDEVKKKRDAKKVKAVKNIKRFNKEIEKILKKGNVYSLIGKKSERIAVGMVFFFFAFFALCFTSAFVINVSETFMAEENFLGFFIFGASVLGIIILALYLLNDYIAPKAPKTLKTKFEKWAGFVRAVRASRLKTYPPASAIIWDDIIVYATALGMADKVKKHLSELKSFDIERFDRLDEIRLASCAYYTSAYRLNLLATYGSRSGPRRSGGFSSSSSGGWSSGGGGFSGGSSGGGGFR